MRYRIFNGFSENFTLGEDVKPLNFKGEVIICFDPSKTNTAMVVENKLHEILSIVEMSGNNWKSGPVIDTTLFCSELQEFLIKYLSNVTVYKVYVEKAITKRGNAFYKSTMVLTELRGAILGMFLREYRVKVEEVNNWVWKSHVLPEGYRSQSEKGSKRYFREYLGIKDYEAYFEADVTDCLCIMKYVNGEYPENYIICCDDYEDKLREYKHTFLPLEFKFGREFKFNPQYNVTCNAVYYANRTTKAGYCVLNPDDLSLGEIYGHSNCFLDNNDREVCLVVCPS